MVDLPFSLDAVDVGEGFKLFSAVTGTGTPHERSATNFFDSHPTSACPRTTHRSGGCLIRGKSFINRAGSVQIFVALAWFSSFIIFLSQSSRDTIGR